MCMQCSHTDMSHTGSRASVQPRTQPHTQTGCTWFAHARTHPTDSPTVSPGFLAHASSGTHSRTLFPLWLPVLWGLAGSTGSNQLSRKPPGWGCGDPRERILAAHGLLRDPLHPVPSPRGSPSPAGSPRLAPHQEEGKVRARSWGQSGGHVLTSAPALTREAPATAPGLPRGGPRRPGSSRPRLGPPASAASMWEVEGVTSTPPPQKAAVFRAIMAPSSPAWRYQHPSPPSSELKPLSPPPPERGDGQG